MSLRLLWKFKIFCLLYIHMNKLNLHMTNLKLSNSDSAYSACLVKFYENCLQTNKQTHTHTQQSRFNRRMPNCATVVETANNICEPEIRLNSPKK